MSIQSEITRLNAAKAGLKTAIEGKGVTVAADATLDAYPALVDSIEAGGGGEPGDGIPVKFLNLITGEYMGTIYVEENHAMTAADFPAAENLAETADHPAFNFDRWEHGVGTVIKRPRTILAYYDKVDKTKSEFYCTVEAGQKIQLWVKSGSVVDWGDNSESETFTGAKFAVHAYSTAGDYKVTMSGAQIVYFGYQYNICPFHSIYAGSAELDRVVTNSTNMKKLRKVYLRNCTFIDNFATGGLFYRSGLVVATLPEGLSLGSSMFTYCSDLIGVGFGFSSSPNANQPGASCFSFCSSLEDITIPPYVEDSSSFASFFSSCVSLKNVELPNITKIGASWFQACYTLREFEVPSGVTSLDQSVFNNCMLLERVSLPAGLLTIDHTCFANTAIRSLDIPDSVGRIYTPSSAAGVTLSSCLEHLKLPAGQGFTTINARLCKDLYGLVEVTIPANVTSIGATAFGFSAAPTNYERIVHMLSSTPPSITSDTFYAASGLRIIVPAGSLEAYQTASNWTALVNYLEEAE